MNNTRAIAAILLAATIVLGGTLVAMTTQAFAAKNLNSSKSNIYRQSSSQNQYVEGGSAEQVSSNTCNCPSNDITLIVNNDDD